MAESVDEDDVAPIDLSSAPEQHLYPVEEEDEEAELNNALDPSLLTTPMTPLPASATLTENTIDDASLNDLPATAIAAPPNAVAPAAFAPPAYREEPPDLLSYALPHSSMEYLLPPESRLSSRRSCRHRARSRPRSRLFPLFRFPRRFRRFWRLKRKERNIAAASCSILVIAFLVASLALPSWFHLYGGACKRHHLGALDFFRLGAGDLTHPDENAGSRKPEPSNPLAMHPSSGDGENVIWSDCVTSEILMLMRTVIVLLFGAISFTSAAFLLDASGAQTTPYKYIRRHGLGNILTVLLCVVVNGFAYWVSTLIRAQQSANKTLAGKKIVVTFDVSFYLVVGAGGLSVVATAANLLKQHPTEEEEQISRLIDCDENDEGEDVNENLLERRMRSRGDLSSLCDPDYGDTLMSTYPRSMRVAGPLPAGPPRSTVLPRPSQSLLNTHPPCSSNALPPPYTP